MAENLDNFIVTKSEGSFRWGVLERQHFVRIDAKVLGQSELQPI